jgi:hypothetical protein
LYRFEVISDFVIAENGGKTISVAKGRARPKVTSSIGSLTPIWYRSVVEFCVLSLTDQKFFDFFDLHAKCPLKNSGEGYSPMKEFSIDETPKRHFLVANVV